MKSIFKEKGLGPCDELKCRRKAVTTCTECYQQFCEQHMFAHSQAQCKAHQEIYMGDVIVCMGLEWWKD